MRQILEILRLLYRGADVLILDEPTAVLAPSQIQDLLALMRKLKAEGRTIVFISHKLEEVMEVADAITVMRSGRVVTTTTPASTTVAALATAMVGEAVVAARLEPRSRPPGRAACSAREASSELTPWASSALARSTSTCSPARSSASPVSAATGRTNSSPARPALPRLSRARSRSTGAT